MNHGRLKGRLERLERAHAAEPDGLVPAAFWDVLCGRVTVEDLPDPVRERLAELLGRAGGVPDEIEEEIARLMAEA